MQRPTHYVSLPSAFGTFCIVWREASDAPRVYRIFLSSERTAADGRVKTTFAGATQRSCSAIADLGGRIQAMLHGQPIKFDLDLAALEICSPFQRRVLLAEHAIPRGCVSTYGRIARHLEVSNGARAVGNALARNPFPLVIPCHRAIGANGRLGGYQGGLAMKRALLEMEGVEVSANGKVLSPKLFYQAE